MCQQCHTCGLAVDANKSCISRRREPGEILVKTTYLKHARVEIWWEIVIDLSDITTLDIDTLTCE